MLNFFYWLMFTVSATVFLIPVTLFLLEWGICIKEGLSLKLIRPFRWLWAYTSRDEHFFEALKH